MTGPTLFDAAAEELTANLSERDRGVWRRFWSKVVEGSPYFGLGPCWQWTGARTQGYGSIGYPTSAGWRSLYAHRLTYEWFVGPIPEGFDIDHLCRNRACCNPRHLEAVSPATNKLRGVSVPASNALKTHCKWGHEFTPENTIVVKAPSHPNGGRHCRECVRERKRKIKTWSVGLWEAS